MHISFDHVALPISSINQTNACLTSLMAGVSHIIILILPLVQQVQFWFEKYKLDKHTAFLILVSIITRISPAKICTPCRFKKRLNLEQLLGQPHYQFFSFPAGNQLIYTLPWKLAIIRRLNVYSKRRKKNSFNIHTMTYHYSPRLYNMKTII